jgi:hypothetical protein
MKPNKQTHSLTQKENKSPLPKRGNPSAPQRRQGVFQKRLAATETGHTYSLTHSLTHYPGPHGPRWIRALQSGSGYAKPATSPCFPMCSFCIVSFLFLCRSFCGWRIASLSPTRRRRPPGCLWMDELCRQMCTV